MKVLILGAGGMLGHKLMEVLPRRFEVVGTMRRRLQGVRHPSLAGDNLRLGVDADDFDSIVAAVAETRPDAVVNCIGIVKQRSEAKDPIPSLKINSLFPHRLAKLCQAGGIRLVHISTDCVFSGSKGSYTEADPCDAQDLYGRTKYLGEVGGSGCMTVRTSMIGRELAIHSGLVDWFLSQRGRNVRGYTKAIFTGFTTSALAEIIADLLDKHAGLEGVWQIAAEKINKFDLLEKINRQFGLGVTIQRDEEFACDRSLDGSRFREATGFRPPSWDAMIAALHAESKDYPQLRE